LGYRQGGFPVLRILLGNEGGGGPISCGGRCFDRVLVSIFYEYGVSCRFIYGAEMLVCMVCGDFQSPSTLGAIFVFFYEFMYYLLSFFLKAGIM
jgi:hypothetical protein